MNALNRFLVVLIALFLMVAALTVIVLAWGFSDESINRLGDMVQYMHDHENDPTRLVITGVAGGIVLFALVLLVLELVRSVGKTVTIVGVEGSTAVLTTEAVVHRIEHIVLQNPGVDSVRARVKGRNNKVEVELQILVDFDTELDVVANQISQATTDAIVDKMKLALAKPPRLQLHYSVPRQAKEKKAPPPERQPSKKTAAPEDKIDS